ncbi:hypothetical protein GGTG_05919 [Gaeumannomyces tritici R3-111a-1]|uniref:WSC domain-containing protein n=1 Tax=Gaeumannomyces tritici (strain R3-111a-1) TaxID=644352 RepID=J3NXB2_GAET3|nr:hypothetical protein GGTG_05919 [Gaeumannomyces tritici R3-111a-1]EJT75994.1 hypothetical protein GGTG_05919 [Gaeumannomyces tritici R3-111a-1]
MYKIMTTQLLGVVSLLAATSLAQQILVPQGCMVISASTFGDITPIPLAADSSDGVNAPQPCANLCVGKNMTHAAVYAQFCACTNDVQPVEILGASSCNFSCQAPFQNESCGGSTEDGDPIYNVFSIMRVDNSTATPSSTTTLSTELPPATTTPSTVSTSSAPTIATTNTPSTSLPPPLVTGGGATRPANNVSVVTQTTTLPTCPTCTKNGGGAPAPTATATAIAPECPPGGLCIFINIYFITTVVQAPDGLGLVTTATPTRSTIYYDPAQSTVTTVVEMGRTRIVLVPVNRVATVIAAANNSSSSSSPFSVAATATTTNTDDPFQTTTAPADLLPLAAASSSSSSPSSDFSSSSSSSSLPASSTSLAPPPPPVVIQMANVTTTAAPSATTDVNGTVLIVTRLPDPPITSVATAASVPSDRVAVLSWLGVVAAGTFLLL